MFVKIQPQQIQLHEFSSPSGHFNFSVGSDTVTMNLSPNITGDFFLVGGLDIQGSLFVNGVPIGVGLQDNNVSEKNAIFFGSGNDITETGNAVFRGDQNDIGGTNNAVLSAFSSQTNAQSSNNTIVAGRSVFIQSGVAGTVVLKDNSSSALLVDTSDDLIINFSEGEAKFVETPVVFDEDSPVQFSGDALFHGNVSGLGLESYLTTGEYLTGSSSHAGTKIFDGNIRVNGIVSGMGQLLLNSAPSGIGGLSGSGVAFYPTSLGDLNLFQMEFTNLETASLESGYFLGIQIP